MIKCTFYINEWQLLVVRVYITCEIIFFIPNLSENKRRKKKSTVEIKYLFALLVPRIFKHSSELKLASLHIKWVFLIKKMYKKNSSLEKKQISVGKMKKKNLWKKIYEKKKFMKKFYEKKNPRNKYHMKKSDVMWKKKHIWSRHEEDISLIGAN